MPLLAFDIGSSSVKAALLTGPRPLTPIAQSPFPTHYEPGRAEVDPTKVLRALKSATAQLPQSALKKADALAFSVMSPSWLALDKRGNPLTPIITHQDRRSLEEAHHIENVIGRQRHLNITGNPPVPGGISSTTYTWFLHHHPALMNRAALVGHLNTYLIHHLTGTRAIDPANASFTGLYETTTQGTWSDEILSALRIPTHTLPDILPAEHIAGHLLPAPARALGLRPGTPVLTGLIDTSSAMLLATHPSSLNPHPYPQPGQLLNVSGTTDVLSVLTTHPKPAETHLTRALGVSPAHASRHAAEKRRKRSAQSASAGIEPQKLWLHVATLASSGSALTWAHSTFFPDLDDAHFWPLVRKLARHPDPNNVTFSPYLAGSRTTIDQPTGAFQNLTLSTTRDHLLSAIIESLAAASAARLPTLRSTVPNNKLLPTVLTSGGTLKTLSAVLLRDWPYPPRGPWRFHYEDQATLRGLGTLWQD